MTYLLNNQILTKTQHTLHMGGYKKAGKRQKKGYLSGGVCIVISLNIYIINIIIYYYIKTTHKTLHKPCINQAY
jgi:hypothetical protein